MTPETGAAELERLYERMLRIRLLEDAVHRLFLNNEIEGTTHLYQGQEAVAVGVCDRLRKGDTVAATYRGHGAALALGVDQTELLGEFLGRELGTNGGRGGSMNVIDLKRGLIGCFGIVGGSIAAATGASLASQLRKDGSVAVAFFGDGAVNQAYFHECLNFAGSRKLPVVYVCENNLYGEWTSMFHVTAGGDIVGRAAAYGMPGVVVDGNDVLAVCETAGEAIARARRRGPDAGRGEDVPAQGTLPRRSRQVPPEGRGRRVARPGSAAAPRRAPGRRCGRADSRASRGRSRALARDGAQRSDARPRAAGERL